MSENSGFCCADSLFCRKLYGGTPDSALNLLKRIPNPESLHGKAQADYSLLMTQAMDKNYIKPESDSLISIAVGCYGSLDDNGLRKESHSFIWKGNERT